MDQETQQAIAQHAVVDTVGVKVASTATYAGAGVTVIFGLNLNEWGVLFGIAFTAITLAVNFWFQYDRRKREMREHALRVHDLQQSDRRTEDIRHEPERRK